MRLELQLVKREEVDVLGGPNIEQILLQVIAVTFVPGQFVLLIDSSKLLSLYVELDTAQKFGLLQICLDGYLHAFNLDDSNQQKTFQRFNVLKANRILTLPI